MNLLKELFGGGLVAKLCPTLVDCSLPASSVHRDSLGKNTWVGCRALLQGIFPTQGSNPRLPYCRQIFYHLNHQGSPRILEWVPYHFSRGSSQFRDWTQVSHIADGFFTIWATREAQGKLPTGVGSLSLLQGTTHPRNHTGVSCIAGRFFTSWATREALKPEEALFCLIHRYAEIKKQDKPALPKSNETEITYLIKS